MPEGQDKDATHILAADHREVEDLFAKFENASGEERKREIANKICTELKIHAMIEEEIFYPACESAVEEDLYKEAFVEHDGAKLLINEIVDGAPGEDFYDAKVKVLQEQIEHHVKEEEKQQGNMFQKARATDVDLEAIGERMLARKQELMAQAQSEGLPPAQPATMDTSFT
jgi:DUF438 domain-containing protein